MVHWKLCRTLWICCFFAIHLSALGQASDVSARIVVRGKRSGSVKNDTASAVVVWLSPVDAAPSRPPAQPHSPYRLLQKDKQFTPHLLVVPTGSNVQFPNADPFFHNVFSLFNGKRFDLGLYESGTSRSVRFDREGISYIFCNIHPEMGAVVLTISTPFYAISNGGGEIAIHGVPPGRYRMQVWSEQARVLDQSAYPREVLISAPQADLGEIDMGPVPSPLSDHKNKFGEEYRPEPGAPY